jgi:hypothetical protein
MIRTTDQLLQDWTEDEAYDNQPRGASRTISTGPRRHQTSRERAGREARFSRRRPAKQPIFSGVHRRSFRKATAVAV